MKIRNFLLYFNHEHGLSITVMHGWETLYTGTFNDMPEDLKNAEIELEKVNVFDHSLLIDTTLDPVYTASY